MSTPNTPTRDRIIQAANELFYEHGYAGSGMAEILKKAKANSGSFYFFFKGKEELLLAVLDWYLANLQPVLLAPIYKQSHDPFKRIFLLLEFYRANVLRTGFAFGCPIGRLALEVEPDRRAVHDKIAANFSSWSGAVEKLLKEAETQGRLSAGCNVRQLARFVLTVMEGAVMQARSYRSIEPFDDCIAQLKVYFRALEKSGGKRGGTTSLKATSSRSKRKRK